MTTDAQDVVFLPKAPSDKKSFLREVEALCHTLGPALRDGVINPHQLRLGACLACEILSARAVSARPLVEAQQAVIEAAKAWSQPHQAVLAEVRKRDKLHAAVAKLRVVEGG